MTPFGSMSFTVPSFAIRSLQVLTGRRELYAVALGEHPVLLPINGHTHLSARIVGSFPAVCTRNRKEIFLRVDARNARVLALFDAGLSRGARIPQNVVDLVLRRPGPVCTGHLLARYKSRNSSLITTDHTSRLQLAMNALINLHT
jgi:hypothetical protein